MYINHGYFDMILPDELKEIEQNMEYDNKKLIDIILCPPNRAILITDKFEKIYYNFN